MTQTHSLPIGQPSLHRARTLWFIATAVGQWTFVYFIVAFYFGSTLRGQFESWNTKPLIDGHIPGDTSGNLVFASHVLLAAIMTAGGTLQLLPQLRARLPRLHRWNGRLFLLTATTIAVGGLYLVWVRGTYLNFAGALAISLDALLILVFGGLALRSAITADFDAHRRWALRTFMAANGVWMLRVGMMLWAVATGGVGMTRRMDGPFDLFWIFGCYLLPLAILEIDLRLHAHSSASMRFLTAGLIAVASFGIAVGSVAAYAIMWSPYL